MRHDLPLYEGDSIIHRSVTSLLEGAGKTAFAAPYVDFEAIERDARRKRAEAIGTLFARMIEWFDARIRRARYRELEAYLGESTDLADLERRLGRMGHEQRGVLAG